jgi:NAD-dependent DNA ligase
MGTPLNRDGQVFDGRITERRRVDRAIHEMLGLIKGMLLDGEICPREAEGLHTWMQANSDATKLWPGHVLAERLRRIFDDGMVSKEECNDLRELLTATAGSTEDNLVEENPSTKLPFDDPQPELTFEGRIYLLTGKFVFGTRRQCQAAVLQRGGTVVERVTQQVNTLVVGCIGSRDWVHTSWGRKIEEVVQLRQRGFSVNIVSEAHWVPYVQRI